MFYIIIINIYYYIRLGPKLTYFYIGYRSSMHKRGTGIGVQRSDIANYNTPIQRKNCALHYIKEHAQKGLHKMNIGFSSRNLHIKVRKQSYTMT
jgi:hypothetical protein